MLAPYDRLFAPPSRGVGGGSLTARPDGSPREPRAALAEVPDPPVAGRGGGGRPAPPPPAPLGGAPHRLVGVGSECRTRSAVGPCGLPLRDDPSPGVRQPNHELDARLRDSPRE